MVRPFKLNPQNSEKAADTVDQLLLQVADRPNWFYKHCISEPTGLRRERAIQVHHVEAGQHRAKLIRAKGYLHFSQSGDFTEFMTSTKEHRGEADEGKELESNFINWAFKDKPFTLICQKSCYRKCKVFIMVPVSLTSHKSCMTVLNFWARGRQDATTLAFHGHLQYLSEKLPVRAGEGWP